MELNGKESTRNIQSKKRQAERGEKERKRERWTVKEGEGGRVWNESVWR